MRLSFLFLASLSVAKHRECHDRKSTDSTSEPQSEGTSCTTVTVGPGGETLAKTATSTSPHQLRTRDSGDLRSFRFRGWTRTLHVATTTTLPVTETFTATPSPSLLTTTEAITITETTSPAMVSSSVVTPSAKISTTISSNLQLPRAEECYNLLGGLQSNGTVTSGCGGMLVHIQTCYNAYKPGSDPVNSDQNYVFQACVCDTSKDVPFTSDNVLYQNYTGCAACLLSLNLPDSGYIYTAAQDLWSFCRSQNPFPYLFFSELTHALGQPQIQINGPFIPSPLLTLPAPIPVTTIPPLANLAFGASAPSDGSLAKVTPSLVTYTTSTTKRDESGISQETITSLAVWVPTQVGKAWNHASASRSEAVAVSSKLASDICKDRQLGECPQSSGWKRKPSWIVVLFCAVIVAMIRRN